VIAISSAKEGVVKHFGHGVYAGDFKLPDDAGGFNFGQENPRIDLDDGKTVWGCECWWGDEEKTQERYSDWTWELVDIEELRKGGKE